jgi:protein-S-isoprenylcysteine O-methyltransferase Ste14
MGKGRVINNFSNRIPLGRKRWPIGKTQHRWGLSSSILCLFNKYFHLIKTLIMKKIPSLLYGVVCYLAFFGTILYAIGFVGNLIVPKTIDSIPSTPLTKALLVNASLLLLFALQHSIMARPAFKNWWTKIIPPHLERSTYVLLASLCLMLMMWQWQPIGGVVWSVQNGTIKNLLLFTYITGWAIVFVSTFLINHFDLFGLRQVWLYFRGKHYMQLPFRIPIFYKYVRHPLYLGFLIAFWSTPVMTIAHLLFAILTTGYILTAIQFEENDLQNYFGEKYRNYKKLAPMIIPFSKRKTAK